MFPIHEKDGKLGSLNINLRCSFNFFLIYVLGILFPSLNEGKSCKFSWSCATPREPQTVFGTNETCWPMPHFARIIFNSYLTALPYSFGPLPWTIIFDPFGPHPHSPDVNHCVSAVSTRFFSLVRFFISGLHLNCKAVSLFNENFADLLSTLL